jgi:hypothetical protein
MLYVSFEAYYCAHCLFEKLIHILTLIHALPTRGRKCASNSWEMHFVTRGGCIMGEKKMDTLFKGTT